MKHLSFILFCILILGGTNSSAQNFEEYKRQQQESFNAFKQKNVEDYAAYRKRINEEFADFLKMNWEEKDGNEPIPEPPKIPDIPPIVLPEVDSNIPKDKKIDIKIDIAVRPPEDEPKPIAPIDYTPKPQEKTISFSFYGTDGIVRFDNSKKASLKGCKENDVSSFWKELSGENYDNLLADCLNQKQELDLCDWAYFKMTEIVSQTIYGKTNDAVVFQVWLLAQSGYNARLGRDNNNIHLLLHTNEMIFNKPYWRLNNGLYFLLDGYNVDKMNIMGMSFPETKAVRLSVVTQNKFLSKDTEGRLLKSKKYPDAFAQIVCNRNLLDFMNDYPSSAIEDSNDTDWLKYAYTPLSKTAKDKLYPALMQQIEGKDEADAANILLNFVQTAFEYKTDNEVWGVERPFFPEETLYYPYCDCEDRAILFCRLVTDLMGLKTALIYYPGHLASAVQFRTDIKGDYFVIDGKRYLICDPTYINAPIGQTMPRKDNSTAKVYPL